MRLHIEELLSPFQKASWRDLHKEECTYLAAVAPRVPTDTARLMARAVIRLRKGEHDLYKSCNDTN